MNTTPRIITGWIAASLTWGALSASAAASPLASQVLFMPAVVGQLPARQESPEITRLKAVDLCKRARQAIEEGNFETAESLLSRAEALKANFGMIYMGDQPKKVRKDLERAKQGKGGNTAAARPSQRFSPEMPNGEKPKSAAASETAPASTPAAATAPSTMPTANDPKVQAKGFLAKARSELAQSNMAGALYWYERSLQTGAVFTAGEYSPDTFAAEFRQAGGKLPAQAGPTAPIAAAPKGEPAPTLTSSPARSSFPTESPFARPTSNLPPSGAEDQVPSFLKQAGGVAAARTEKAAAAGQLPATAAAGGAEGDRKTECQGHLLAARRALAVGDVRRASESLNRAKACNVRFEFTADSPAKVEAAIYKFNELTQRAAAERDSEAYRRRYAELQMQQAEELLRWRDFDEAERLVNEAKRLGLSYGPFEANPDGVLGRIADARKQSEPPRGKVELLPPVENARPLAAVPSAAPAVASPPAASAGPSLADMKARTLELVNQARVALAAGELDRAEALAQQAQKIGVPESAYSPQDYRPFIVMFEIEKLRRNRAAPVQAVIPIGATGQPENTATGVPLVYDPSNDPTQTVQATAQVEEPIGAGAQPRPVVSAAQQAGAPPESRGLGLFMQGEEALRRHDAKAAYDFFRQAQAYHDELEPAIQQRLQDHLQLGGSTPATRPEGSLIKEATAAQQVKLRQVTQDLTNKEAQAKQLQDKDPLRAKAVLEEGRAIVEKAALETAAREACLRKIDRAEAELAKYVEANRGKIELNERNDRVRDQIDHEQKHKVEVQDKLAILVEQYNQLIDEQRFAEADVVVKRCRELAPHEPIVAQIVHQSKFVRRMAELKDVREASEAGVVAALHSVDVAAVPFDDSEPYKFSSPKDWKELTDRRRATVMKEGRKRSPKELEIQQKLKTPVSVRFKEQPLSQVMDNLAKLAQVNLYLDPSGLREEGVSTDTPVTIDLSEDISLRSALSLILSPLHLSWVIKDEVLKITSEEMRDGAVYTVTYNVADLVIPIPNFSPNGHMGLAGALHDAQAQAGMGVGGTQGFAGQGLMTAVASRDGSPMNAMIDPKVLGQFNVPNPTGGMGGGMGMGMGGGGGTGMQQNIPFGPGGMGGGAQPDFDSLIELITGTIAPTTWSEVGGAGAIKHFATNLSLVISQTQEVHEEIADLLEQLRRLQDLQVTIEVRFINLSDIFYEKMGVDFNVSLPTYSQQQGSIFGAPLPNGTPDALGNPQLNLENRSFQRDQSVTVGLTGTSSAAQGAISPMFSSDLQIPFTQTSFGVTQPPASTFGIGSLPGGATLGFAIMSELEAYFFMEAVQSDTRTNVMQSPKVTLFNGQQAFVSDTTQSPFVISVMPVVGDFAAAQQPIIVVLSSGTFLSVQAVVSSDRRFVRLTVVPFFSQVGAVNTFTFTGSASSTTTSSSDGPSDNTTANSDSATNSREGTTVQLPEYAFTTVTTTVSVPDGGTVLLGGIKRLTEERLENGVPILNKLPYINRLFDNIGTGRSTSSLMMMVTPRIIIQEEEEARLGVQPGT